MRRTDRFPRPGFTLIELMLVIAIIGILMAMVGAAAFSARKRAWIAQATAETQQIATAFKSYYLANKDWPSDWAGGTANPEDPDGKPGYLDLTRKSLDPLIGEKGGLAFLDVQDGVFENDRFVDPWGNPYQVSSQGLAFPKATDVFEGAVSFPSAMRHYYEEGVYDPYADWEWDDRWNGYF